MRREDLEHVIGAAANVTGEDEFVVIGSQAILGGHPHVPHVLLTSMDVDIYPRAAPGKADLIDGALGDGSMFHRTFGYYAHGVGPETVQAPAGWQERLRRLPIPARPHSERRPVALCLEPHDLVLAKCAAGRDRDWEYAAAALAAGIVAIEELRRRIDTLPVAADRRRMIAVRLAALAARPTR